MSTLFPIVPPERTAVLLLTTYVVVDTADALVAYRPIPRYFLTIAAFSASSRVWPSNTTLPWLIT